MQCHCMSVWLVIFNFFLLCFFVVSDGSSVNFTALGLPEVGSDDHREMWMSRIREVKVTRCLHFYLHYFFLFLSLQRSCKTNFAQYSRQYVSDAHQKVRLDFNSAVILYISYLYLDKWFVKFIKGNRVK